MWNDFKEENMKFLERDAKIIYPSTKPNGKLILKAEYLDAFPDFEIEMLKKGYYLCYITHNTRWANDEEVNVTAEFVKYVAEMLNIEPKCIVVGMSCGGLLGSRLAEEYPELVSVLYLDAPVLNILSMAGLGESKEADSFWRELSCTYGFSKTSVINFRKSPIDKMEPLIKNNIPIIMIYGNADTTVIYEENGKVLEEYYKENGGIIKVIPKSMCHHHPHGLKDPTPIIEFVERYI